MKNDLNINRQNEAFEICNKLLAKVGVKLNVDGVVGESRVKELNFQRALIVFILRHKGYTFSEIGAFLFRDHSTIINLFNYLNKKQARDERFKYLKKTLSANIIEISIKKKIKYHEAQLKKLLKQL